LETLKGATQTTFEIINDSLVAGKSASEILLAKLENIKSRIGVRSKDEGPVASSTLWGAIYELADMFTDEPGRHKEDVVFSAEEMDNLQELLLDTCYGNHLHPFIKESLKDFITLADSNKNTELLLDGADRVNDDLKHIVRLRIADLIPTFKPGWGATVRDQQNSLECLTMIWIRPCPRRIG
jgi:hypothetical protein